MNPSVYSVLSSSLVRRSRNPDCGPRTGTHVQSIILAQAVTISVRIQMLIQSQIMIPTLIRIATSRHLPLPHKSLAANLDQHIALRYKMNAPFSSPSRKTTYSNLHDNEFEAYALQRTTAPSRLKTLSQIRTAIRHFMTFPRRTTMPLASLAPLFHSSKMTIISGPSSTTQPRILPGIQRLRTPRRSFLRLRREGSSTSTL